MFHAAWDAISSLLSNLWSGLNLSPLFSWMPSDLTTVISSFIAVLFILAIKRAFLS